MVTTTNIQNSTKVAFSLEQIFDYKQEELDVIFDSLPAASEMDLEGPYKGKLFAIMGIQRLPRFFNRWITRVLQIPLVVWAGKGFYGENGSNLWFTTSRKIPFGHYKIGLSETLKGSGNVISLDYEVDNNLGLLKPIMGEARKVGEGQYLARMMWRTKKSNVCVLYFSLKNK